MKWIHKLFNIMYIIVISFILFQAYDQHLNMILGDVEETVTTLEIDEETYEEIYKVIVAGVGGYLCKMFMNIFILSP